MSLTRLTLLLGALACAWALSPAIAAKETLTIAVASNFASTAKVLAAQFEAEQPYRLRLSIGSTGKHYAQIQHGAPYDIFLAADKRHPTLIAEQSNSRAFRYAIGQLALWQPNASSPPNIETLKQSERLAIANPKLAPYGAASESLLTKLGLLDSVRAKLITGENIAQAFQFVASGHVSLGFVSFSQVLDKPAQQYWLIPSNNHPALEQYGVALNQRPASQQFQQFILSDAAKLTIQKQGYLTR